MQPWVAITRPRLLSPPFGRTIARPETELLLVVSSGIVIGPLQDESWFVSPQQDQWSWGTIPPGCLHSVPLTWVAIEHQREHLSFWRHSPQCNTRPLAFSGITRSKACKGYQKDFSPTATCTGSELSSTCNINQMVCHCGDASSLYACALQCSPL